MPAAIAIAAHPDDIEFVMAGTLLLLHEAGWEIHYCNVSNGNLGSTAMSLEKTAQVRRKEAQAAAKLLGAQWHPPFCEDLQIFYTDENLRRLCAVVRDTEPAVVLTHALEDYMEDHMMTARLAVTATFARGMPHYQSLPKRTSVTQPCVLYHAMPHGQCTPMREPVLPEFFIDTTAVQWQKRAALACHASQKEWLDATQGMDSYLEIMDAFSRALAKQSRQFQHSEGTKQKETKVSKNWKEKLGRFQYAEGWSRHLHYGFGKAEDDPLREALGEKYLANRTAFK